MPIYKYKCIECNNTKKILVNSSRDVGNIKCNHCTAVMVRLAPKVSNPIVLEKKDKYRNKQVKKDIDIIMKARAKKHFVNHELGNLIDEHGEGHAKVSGWLKNGIKKKLEDYS